MTGLFIMFGCACVGVTIFALLYSYTPKQKD